MERWNFHNLLYTVAKLPHSCFYTGIFGIFVQCCFTTGMVKIIIYLQSYCFLNESVKFRDVLNFMGPIECKSNVPNIFCKVRTGNCQSRWMKSRRNGPRNVLYPTICPLASHELGGLPILVCIQVTSFPLNFYETYFWKLQALRMPPKRCLKLKLQKGLSWSWRTGLGNGLHYALFFQSFGKPMGTKLPLVLSALDLFLCFLLPQLLPSRYHDAGRCHPTIVSRVIRM